MTSLLIGVALLSIPVGAIFCTVKISIPEGAPFYKFLDLFSLSAFFMLYAIAFIAMMLYLFFGGDTDKFHAFVFDMSWPIGCAFGMAVGARFVRFVQADLKKRSARTTDDGPRSSI